MSFFFSFLCIKHASAIFKGNYFEFRKFWKDSQGQVIRDEQSKAKGGLAPWKPMSVQAARASALGCAVPSVPPTPHHPWCSLKYKGATAIMEMSYDSQCVSAWILLCGILILKVHNFCSLMAKMQLHVGSSTWSPDTSQCFLSIFYFLKDFIFI